MTTDKQLVRRVTRASAVTRLFIIALIVFVVVTVTMMTTLTIQNSHRGKENRAALVAIGDQTKAIKAQAVRNHKIAEAIKGTAQRINDCTRPTGRCFSKGQARTAAAVGSINLVVVLAAACAVDQHGDIARVQAAIEACVKARLALARAKP